MNTFKKNTETPTILNMCFHKDHRTKYDLNGVYQLTCLNRHMRYVEQTGSHFSVKFKECAK
jgi:hypothetical protein